jgi:hypothetical protein
MRFDDDDYYAPAYIDRMSETRQNSVIGKPMSGGLCTSMPDSMLGN